MRRVAPAAALLLSALTSVAAATPPPSPSVSPAAEQAVQEMRDALRRDDLDGAIRTGEAAVEAGRGTAQVQLWLGRAYGQKAATASIFKLPGLAKRCRACFERAVDLAPEDLDAHFELMRYHFLAPGIVGGDHAIARAQAAEIARRDPARGHDAVAAILEHEKDLTGAEAELRKAIAADPRSLNVASSFGGFLLRRKRYDEAAAFWQGRLAADPSELRARYALARVALASEKGLPEAVAHLQAFLARPADPDGPTWADGRWRLGLVYEKLGRREEAVRELREALRLFPGHAGATKDLARLGKG